MLFFIILAHNCFFAFSISTAMLYLITFEPKINSDLDQLGFQNSKRLVEKLLIITTIIMTESWILIFIFVLLYQKFYRKYLYSCILKLKTSLRTIQQRNSKIFYVIAILCVTLNIYFLCFCLIFIPELNVTDLKTTLNVIWKPISTYYILNFCSFFYLVVGQVFSSYESLKRDINCIKCKAVSHQKLSKKQPTKINASDISQEFSRIRKKLIELQEGVESIFSFFELPLSFIYLSHLFFVIVETTRMANSRIEYWSLMIIIANTTLLLLTLYTSDVLSKQVCM